MKLIRVAIEPLEPGETEHRETIINEEVFSKVAIGRVPVMLRSSHCQLKHLSEINRVKNGHDCKYDQGGYFIINGSEKVIVAQERTAYNQVTVFYQKPPNRFAFTASIRS